MNALSKKANLKLPIIDKLVGLVLTICGALGMFASFMLSIEEMHFLKNPGQALNCDINPLIGCGGILNTWQGHVFFGIPNQFFGLAAFSVLTTLGVLLLAKVALPKWIWLGLQAGALVGVLGVLWFLYQSLFVLNHLCPYCMLTWVVTIIVSWYITVRNIVNDNLPVLPASSPTATFIRKYHLEILVTVFVVLVFVVLFRFRDFFFG